MKYRLFWQPFKHCCQTRAKYMDPLQVHVTSISLQTTFSVLPDLHLEMFINVSILN